MKPLLFLPLLIILTLLSPVKSDCSLKYLTFPLTNFTKSLYVNTINNWQSDNGSMAVYARDGINPNFVNLASGSRSFWYTLIREPWTDICMNVVKYQYIQVIIRSYTLESFQLFFTAAYSTNCKVPGIIY